MTKPKLRLLLPLLLPLTLLACADITSSVTLSTGRVVQISTDQGVIAVSTDKASSTATIKLQAHTVVVAPKSVRLDGTAVAELSPTENSISVRVAGGSVVITAGQEEIFRRHPE